MVDFIGAARDPQFRQDVGQGLVDAFGRGLSMIGGAPVDLTTMFLRPLGYSVPDEQIVGSSEYIGRQMANLGLISETRNPAAEFLSALLIPDPTDIQKLAPYVQRAMSADLVAARPSTPGAAMRAQRGSVGVEKPKFPAVKPGDIKTSYRGGEIIQKRKFDNDTEIQLTVNINPEDNLASAYLEAGGRGLETDGEVPTGTGTATAMYKNALQWAKDKGVGWISDSIMSNQSQRMYERLIEQGIPFELGGLPGYPSQYFLSAEKLATVPNKVLATKYSSENIDDAMPRLFDLLAAETSPPRPQAPREESLRIAQENAAKPVSEGGLGLPPDNTAMDRARAMGFDTPTYRGTSAEEVYARPGTYSSGNIDYANRFATGENANIIPLLIRRGEEYLPTNKSVIEGIGYSPEMQREVSDIGAETVSWVNPNRIDRGASGWGDDASQFYSMNPSNIRSRFAAFDPARRYESDLLGSVDPRLLAILGPATAAAVYGLGELYANQRRDEQTR
jgi:hypothetical protein